MKRFINITILIGGITFIYLIVNNILNFKCIFKTLWKVSCSGCGLTRSFEAILHLKFIEAIKYNILGIPIFIVTILTIISLVIDIFKNKNYTLMKVRQIFKIRYVEILILLGITMIINNIQGI